MEWAEEGIILATRPHGEAAAIIDVLTRDHGRHAGLVRGGNARRLRAVLEPGNQVHVRWRARLADHLGTFTVEPVSNRAAALIGNPLGLAGLTSACAVAQVSLPERAPHPPVYDSLTFLLDVLPDLDDWGALLVRWELGLLDALGFGLDLSKCAATGSPEDLVYVSPRTGRAVSRAAGAPYQDRLLPLPAFLLGAQMAAKPPTAREIDDGLALTGFFLSRCLLEPQGRKMPPARHRLRDRLGKSLKNPAG